LTYFSLWYLGETYYRLGMTPEAEHCAFEALASSPKEPNAQTMRRLVTTNIVRRDSATVAKYIGFFERSLAYRGWARQQRTHLALAMNDTAYHIPDIPISRRFHNFFITYQHPDFALLKLLQTNPTHRLAFEYLMAYYMLQKDIEGIKWCFDSFFKNFDYPDIPTHYEEALLVYQNSTRAGDEFYAQYPVSRTTRERFNRYFQALQGSRRNYEQLEKQFGNTYWFYVHFIEPSTLQKKDETNRY
jgi:tetratricopeptide (TPR) repeat protein